MLMLVLTATSTNKSATIAIRLTMSLLLRNLPRHSLSHYHKNLHSIKNTPHLFLKGCSSGHLMTMKVTYECRVCQPIQPTPLRFPHVQYLILAHYVSRNLPSSCSEWHIRGVFGSQPTNINGRRFLPST